MGKVLQRACFHWLGKSSLGLWNHKLACWSSHIMDNNKLGLLRRGLFQGHIESLWGVNLIVEDVIITHTHCVNTEEDMALMESTLKPAARTGTEIDPLDCNNRENTSQKIKSKPTA